jgi:hypothetical protein
VATERGWYWDVPDTVAAKRGGYRDISDTVAAKRTAEQVGPPVPSVLPEHPGRAGGRAGTSGFAMVDKLVTYGLQYFGYSLEVALFLFLLWGARWRRVTSAFAYLVLLLAVDGLGRPYVLYRYGLASRQYTYFFWLTDVLLAFAAFLLVWAFFRRACAEEEKMWRFLRVSLAFVLILVVGISFFSLSRNYSQLFTRFIIEFEQNLYFTCLVLNTLLYIMMQQLQSTDDELAMLVCGTGIQFAGPTVGYALVYLTPGQYYVQQLWSYIAPLCTCGMLLTWFYAVARMPKAVAEGDRAKVPVLAAAVLPGVK